MKKLLSVLFYFLFTGALQATTITYNGYTLDEDTNIVTNDTTGVEWLQWDVTVGWSIANILAELADGNLTIDNVDYGEGWTLTSTSTMAALYNDFFGADDGGDSWSDDESILQMASFSDPQAVEVVRTFNILFGFTGDWYYSYPDQDASRVYGTGTVYGHDENGNDKYPEAHSWVTEIYPEGPEYVLEDMISESATVHLTMDNCAITGCYDPDYSYAGVALNRFPESNDIPEPSPLMIIIFGLVLLGLIRIRQQN